MGRCEFFRNFFTVFLFQLLLCKVADAQNIIVKNAAAKDVLIVNVETGNIIEIDSNSVVYTTKGNLVFSGNSNKHEDVLFMLNNPDVFSKKTGKLLLKENNEAVFTFVKGNVWLGNSTNNKVLLIGKFEKASSTSLVFRLASNREILFTTNIALSAAQSMAVLSYFVVVNNIDETIIEAAKQASAPTLPLGSGTIRRLWGDGNEAFVWDGKILKNQWRFNEYEQWAFDGKYIYRAWFDTGEVLVWDGKTLQSNFGANNTFVHDGNSLRAVFGEANDEFYLQGNIVKRAWVSLGNDEWEINGNIPIPIIMMIVFRLAR